MLLAFHPLHVSFVNLDYYPKEEKCIVSVKVFSDDFASILRKKYGATLLKERDTLCLKDAEVFNKYIRENLMINLNGSAVSMERWRVDSVKNNFEASWLYYSFDFGDQLQEVSVRNTIFFDSFNDQKNLMVIGNGEKEKALQFTRRKPICSIQF